MKDFGQNLSDFMNSLDSAPKGPVPTAEEFIIFKKKMQPLINLDLTNYKNNQMERRIASLMNKNKITNLLAYHKLLESDADKLNEFINMLTINVSEFFRNSEKFAELEKTYLPELLKKKRNLKIWSAGCSIGAEVYSLAMILDKLGVLSGCQLIASDFDKNIIKKAQSGIYSQLEVGTVLPEYKNYFTKVDNDKFKVKDNIIASVKFEQRDLLNSRFEVGFDLILCRNVVIYFTDEAKDKLYDEFFKSLISGGILFIGSTERINNHKEIGYDLRTSFFYQKP